VNLRPALWTDSRRRQNVIDIVVGVDESAKNPIERDLCFGITFLATLHLSNCSRELLDGYGDEPQFRVFEVTEVVIVHRL